MSGKDDTPERLMWFWVINHHLYCELEVDDVTT